MRTIQLPPEVEDMLASVGHQPTDRPFLEALRGKPITAPGLKKAWQRHRARCGVNPALIAHDLRRTGATILYKRNNSMTKLTQEERDRLPEGAFALPGRRYPIHNIEHARDALRMVAAHGTPEEQEEVRRAVHRKYPQIDRKGGN